MLLRKFELTTALRPALFAEEALIFVQDAVGLYHGKDKLQLHQHGQIYLTTHRVCYVDNDIARERSVAIELREVERCDYAPGFLKSSPKVVVISKPARSSSPKRLLNIASSESAERAVSSRNGGAIYSETSREADVKSSTFPPANEVEPVTWICSICKTSNRLLTSFDVSTATSSTPLPPCEACGIVPSFTHVLKAAIAGASGRKPQSKSLRDAPAALRSETSTPTDHDTVASKHHDQLRLNLDSDLQACPSCTYLNHPAMINCEMCGSLLRNETVSTYEVVQSDRQDQGLTRAHDQGLSVETLKFSFRSGGDKAFYEKLKGVLVQRKWLLQTAPPIPAPISNANSAPATSSLTGEDGLPHKYEHSISAGIAGLEKRGLDIRKKNEEMIGSAFEDLEALMASAKEIIALAESFAKTGGSASGTDPVDFIKESAERLDMVTTKEMLGRHVGSESLYLAELSRHLAEYLTDESRGVLQNEGGIMTLVDLWAVFNHTRGGVELVSPSDFEKAAALWVQLKLPVRLRQFRNGLLVVQQADRTDDKTIAQLLNWLQDMHTPDGAKDPNGAHHNETFGKGITAQEVAQNFGWSLGVATEELQMAEENGALCREAGVEGLKYWENWLVDYKDEEGEDIIVNGRHTSDEIEDELLRGLKASGLL